MVTASSQIHTESIRGEARPRHRFKFQVVTDAGECFTVTGEDHSVDLCRSLAIRTRERIIDRGIEAAQDITPPVKVTPAELESDVWGPRPFSEVSACVD